MEKFKFRLEPLLNHRRFTEEALQREFAHVEKTAAEALKAAARLEEEHLRLAGELKEKMQAPRPASENELYATYLASLSCRIDKQQQRVQKAVRERDAKKAALLEAVKNRKMIERLKEVRVDQFQRLCTKAEQAFSDEIGLQQHNRKPVNPNRIE